MRTYPQLTFYVFSSRLACMLTTDGTVWWREMLTSMFIRSQSPHYIYYLLIQTCATAPSRFTSSRKNFPVEIIFPIRIGGGQYLLQVSSYLCFRRDPR